MSRSTALLQKYKHTHTAFVESINKVLAEKLFMLWIQRELQTGEDSENG